MTVGVVCIVGVFSGAGVAVMGLVGVTTLHPQGASDPELPPTPEAVPSSSKDSSRVVCKEGLWFGKVLPCLVVKPSFGGVAILTGPNVVIVRLGPRSLGPMSPGLITPCGLVLSLHHPYKVA
jgi:hypothetical protein